MDSGDEVQDSTVHARILNGGYLEYSDIVDPPQMYVSMQAAGSAGDTVRSFGVKEGFEMIESCSRSR